MFVRRLSLVAVPFALIGLLSCSSGGWPQAKTDPCSLLTIKEVEQALAEPVQAGEKAGASSCVFSAKRHPQNEVTVEIDEAPGKDRKGWFNKERMRKDSALIAGLGDGAVRVESPPLLARVTFLRGDVLITVMVSSLKHRDRAGAVTRLAKAAADRYGSSSFFAMMSGSSASSSIGATPAPPTEAKPPSFPTAPVSAISSSTTSAPSSAGPTRSTSIDPADIVGTWYARSTTGLTTVNQLLVIQPNHAWTLSSTIQLEGSLDAQSGAWLLERFGTVKEKAWQGTYHTTGDEGFATTGSMTAQWTKLLADHTPSRVPPELWQMRREENNALVTNLKTVDPSLIGLWEGTGTYRGGKAEFVWSIKKTSATNVLIMESSQGTVETKDGLLRLLPAQTTRRGMAIVALHEKSFTTSDGKVTIRWNQQPPRSIQPREL